jgi:hypothetical protein
MRLREQLSIGGSVVGLADQSSSTGANNNNNADSDDVDALLSIASATRHRALLFAQTKDALSLVEQVSFWCRRS